MVIIAYSKSDAFKQHIERAVKAALRHRTQLTIGLRDRKAAAYVLHISSFSSQAITKFIEKYNTLATKIVITEDIPTTKNMLHYAQLNIRAYCNSYMAAAHYQQLLELVQSGQSWYPPAMLAEAFELAHRSVQLKSDYEQQLQSLTSREKQIAMCVAEGKSNKVVAREFKITERTVKAHLSHIFKKLHVKDRVALVVYLKQQGLANTGT